jgi:hypothetical protein
MDVCCTVFVLSGRGLCDGADPSSRRVIPTVVCVWVWSSEKKNLYTYCKEVGRRGKDYETKPTQLYIVVFIIFALKVGPSGLIQSLCPNVRVSCKFTGRSVSSSCTCIRTYEAIMFISNLSNETHLGCWDFPHMSYIRCPHLCESHRIIGAPVCCLHFTLR